MNNNDAIKIFRAARDKYGESAQREVISEEIGELLSAKSKYYRGRIDYDNVLDECADVLVCIDQLILNIADRHGYTYEELIARVRGIKDMKVLRLAERVGGES